MKKKLPFVVFTGGGTGGPLMPLFAIYETMRRRYPDARYMLIGTRDAFTRKRACEAGIAYMGIFSGKFRRYFSLRTGMDAVFVALGLLQAVLLFATRRPRVVIAAGGYVGVPVVWAAWLLRVPIIIHQTDVVPGLTNRLCAPCATRITLSVPELLRYFSKEKSTVTGTPIRRSITAGTKERAQRKWGLEQDTPVALIVGGGTGAERLNDLVERTARDLVRTCQIVHITGETRGQSLFTHARYHAFPFLQDAYADALAAANVVVSRAGFSSLAELSVMKKPVILIPLPDTPQVNNARYFLDKHAAVVIDNTISSEDFAEVVRALLADKEKQARLSDVIGNAVPANATERFIEHIASYL